MGDMRITLETDRSFRFSEPPRAGTYPYPDEYWGRFMTYSLTHEDRDYIREMRSHPDYISALEFEEKHMKNEEDMTRKRELWLRDLAVSSKFYNERIL